MTKKRPAKELLNVREKYEANSGNRKHIPKKVNIPLELSNRRKTKCLHFNTETR